MFDADEAVHLKAQGHTVILARVETSPEDVQGMHAAVGILTTRGGMTSHAAVVARGMGRPCVVGAAAVHIDLERETLEAGGITLHKGDVVTIDGSTGQIIKGRVTMREPELSEDFTTLMEWADGFRRMEVRANADTPADARQARAFGAEGIGLCRTEHMFFEESRILAMREMILAERPGRPPHGARQAPAGAASGFHRAVRDHGGAARSPSACSIRRCTSFCRTARTIDRRGGRQPWA